MSAGHSGGQSRRRGLGRKAGASDKLPRQREADFLEQVKGTLRACGWVVYHTQDSRDSESGFTDVVALKGPRILVAELKVEDGRVESAVDRYLAGKGGLSQEEWLAAWRKTPAEVYEWWPSDWPEIERVAMGG